MKSILLVPGIIFAIFLQDLSSQNLQWTKYYNSPDSGPDDAYAMTVDGSGNVYVTGSSYSVTSGNDIVTVKYNSAGAAQWVKRFSGNGVVADIPYSLAVDNSGNVYVAGCTNTGGFYDGVVIKYSPAGIQEWVITNNGAANRDDILYSVGLDAAGNVYVSGMVTNLNVNFGYHKDYILIKYSPAGAQQWKKIYDGPGSGDDEAKAMFVDLAGNVFVTGTSSSGTAAGSDCLTIKYNTTGNIQWTKRYNGLGNGYDQGTSIAVDRLGNVYVTGYITIIAAYTDVITIKYDAAGNLDWAVKYNGNGDSYDLGQDIAVDDSLNVYITGYTTSPANNKDFLTLKYSSVGDRIWTNTYNVSGGDDRSNAITLDITGNVYITGSVTSAGGTSDFATIKYKADGHLMWDRLYSSTGNFNDKSRCIYVDSSYSVYVSGSGSQGLMYSDYLTLKYTQPIGINLISNEIPGDFSLSQNYPNPFNPVTKIKFTVPHNEFILLDVYNALGKKVAALLSENLKAGTYEADFDGFGLPSGVYFYVLSSGEFKKTMKMILIK